MSEDESLREEIEEMFAEEQQKAKHEAKPTPKIRPGYYDEKKYPYEEEQ